MSLPARSYVRSVARLSGVMVLSAMWPWANPPVMSYWNVVVPKSGVVLPVTLPRASKVRDMAPLESDTRIRLPVLSYWKVVVSVPMVSEVTLLWISWINVVVMPFLSVWDWIVPFRLYIKCSLFPPGSVRRVGRF